MPRIRTVKPEFFRHEGLQDLEVKHSGAYPMFVFQGLWLQCDSNGIFQWRPRQLKLDILPFLPFEMASTLEILHKSGYIIRYTADNGKEYGQIPTFRHHQRLTGKEATEGERYPLPPIYESTVKQQENIGEAAGKQQGNIGERQDAQEKEREGEREKEGIKAFCPAPEKTGAEPETEDAAKPDHVLYEIPIVGGGKSTYPITQPMIDEWQQAYPGVDVDQAIRECRQWNIANPTRRKTSSGIARHVVSWLQREQNRGGVVKRAIPGMMKGQSKTYEHNVAAISQAIFELKQEGAAK